MSDAKAVHIEFPEDVARLRKALPWGDETTDAEVQEAWRAYSNHMFAGWLTLNDHYDMGALLDAFVVGVEHGLSQASRAQAALAPPVSAAPPTVSPASGTAPTGRTLRAAILAAAKRMRTGDQPTFATQELSRLGINPDSFIESPSGEKTEGAGNG